MPQWIMPPWKLLWLAFVLALRGLMMSLRWTGPATLSLTALLVGAVAHADRDIVYAARYYAPPGSHRTSHFHLYRINPNGTGRTQLTFGSTDDDGPAWSPDGRWIAFERQSAAGTTEMCIIGAGGGPVAALTGAGVSPTEGEYTYHWSPDSRSLAVGSPDDDKKGPSVSLFDPRTRQVTRRFSGVRDLLWSPDNDRVYLAGLGGSKIVALKTGMETGLGAAFYHPIWLDIATLAGFTSDDRAEQHALVFIGTDGQEKKRVMLKMPPAYREVVSDGGLALLVGHSPSASLLYALNNHNSTVGVDYLFFSLDAVTGAAEYLNEGQFLAWSPDGREFCIAPGRDTTLYDRRRYAFAVRKGATARERAEDEHRLVWSAPLYIRAASGGPMRALTPRLSWVTGADWRKPPKAALKRSL